MDDEQVNAVSQEIAKQQIQTDMARLGQAQTDMNAQQEKGIVSEQLDLSDVLENIYNLLKGHTLQKNNETNELIWVAPESNDMIILSEHGVNYVMGAVQWYLNKNTLLSNYDEKKIDEKMEDLSTTMVDDVFMEYDKMFLYPTLDDIKDELRERISQKVEIKKFARELLGQEVNAKEEKEIEAVILKEMEGKIEREMETIKEQKIKNKLKRFESLIRFVQDSIHSAYMRAWKGQERTTLRQHIHVSENKGGFVMPQNKANYNPFSLIRKS